MGDELSGVLSQLYLGCADYGRLWRRRLQQCSYSVGNFPPVAPPQSGHRQDR